MRKNYRFHSINVIWYSLVEVKSQALRVFHAFSGCETISDFRGKGKKLVWQAWQAYKDIKETFVYLARHPFTALYADSEHVQKIERLTVILYDKSSPLNSVNEARKELFNLKDPSTDRMAPTPDAPLQHT